MKSLRPDFAQKVAALRKAKRPKVSQARLAEEVGVESAQTVSRWERGISVPEMPTLEKLARYLGQPVGFFLDQGVELKIVSSGPLANDLTKIIQKQDTEISKLKGEIGALQEGIVELAPIAEAHPLWRLLCLYLVTHEKKYWEQFQAASRKDPKKGAEVIQALSRVAEPEK